jgi:hypothetical protein
MKEMLRVAAKKALAPLIYRFPPFGLQPERLATYLHSLLERQDLPGDVAEIGCNLGGTSAIAAPHALQRFWPRMVAGGAAIYVDDCPADYDWKARIGYEKFCGEAGLTPRYEYGLGVLYK